MTQSNLVSELVAFSTKATEKMKLPTVISKGDKKQIFRVPGVYEMNLPDSDSYEKLAPYIIVRLISSNHVQNDGKQAQNSANIRFIFCVWNDNESEGAMELLNLMDTIQFELLSKVVIGKHFKLDVHEPLETLIYQQDSAPFYAGEMIGTFILPSIKREVNLEF